MKYSVVIPIYNASATIEKCLNSLLLHPHEDAELLLINDGSEDDSGRICRDYAKRYDCIRYFEKENGGVSSARNLGLREAKGEYILFVDSDDYVTDDYFAVIDQALCRLEPDLLLFGTQCIRKNCDFWSTGDYVAHGEPEVAEKVHMAVREYLLANLMSKVFRGEIIRKNGLRFDERLSIGEDQLFVFQYAMRVRKMASIPNPLYCYVCLNSESLSRKRRDYLAEQLLQANLEMLKALEERPFAEQTRKMHMDSISWIHYRSAYSACKELLKYDLPARERRKRIREICRMYTLPQVKPTVLKCKLIAFPITYRMSFVIDMLAIQSDRRRKKNA